MVSCEKAKEHRYDSEFVTGINAEGFRERYLPGYTTLRERGRFSEGREYVFKKDGNIVFLRIGVFQSKEESLEMVEKLNSMCSIRPQEDSLKTLDLADICWWMPKPSSTDTVEYHYIRDNVYVLVNSHSIGNKDLIGLAKSLDKDIVNGSDYVRRAELLNPPIINSIKASNTILHEGDILKITVNATDSYNSSIEFIGEQCCSLDKDPENVFTISVTSEHVPEPFIGLHTFRFQVINEVNVLSDIGEIEIEIKE